MTAIDVAPFLIRTTTAADGAALRRLRLEALRDSPTAFGSSAAETEQQSVQEWIDRAARGEGKSHEAVFVADAAGDLVALAGIIRQQRDKDQHSAFIWGVYVRPAWRSRGIARQLINAAADWAKSKGVLIVKLTLNSENTFALKCYLRCGFTISGIDPAALAWKGRLYDEILMSRWLVDRPAFVNA